MGHNVTSATDTHLRPEPTTRPGRSLACNLGVHLVFAARHRRGLFDTEMPNAREHVMAQVRADSGASLAEFNTKEDHVHLLADYPPKVAISHLVNSLQGVSSRQLRQDLVARINRAATRDRFWSPSYFAGSCSGPPLSTVKDYITNHKQPDRARLPPCPEGQGFRPRSPMNRIRSARSPRLQAANLPSRKKRGRAGACRHQKPPRL
jgi:putative transposase